MTIGALIAGNMLSMRIAGPFNQLVSNWRIYAQASQAMRRLDDVLNMSEERSRMDVVPSRPKGALSAEGVTFRYSRDLAPAIQDLDLQLGPAGICGIVGPNGSGKTTVLKLLQGLYAPTSGRVLMDGADLGQFSRNVLARWIGYIPQECFFFAGTLRYNITIGRPRASDADIVEAATLAGLHDSVIDLPDGYATEVGEAGSRLSGGFRQRLAIARALVGDPPVLLLDEPTSHLDRRCEEELCNSFRELARERTVVVVTHSPLLLRSCDVVIALERGRVALAGRTAEVLPRIFQRPQVEPRRQAG
jgi:ATP-binding cassette subfamily C protein LapB